MAAQEVSPEPKSVSPIPPSPAAPPLPTMPPEPPPSIVAMRRLMFDTDDAKLMKNDHNRVNTTRIANSIKKDLSTNVDSRSLIDKEEATSVNIDRDKSEDPMNPDTDSSSKYSKELDQCVNSSTIPPSSSHPESARESNFNEINPCSNEEKDDSVKLVDNSSVKEPVDIRQDTLSFNDNCNVSLDKVASHSDSDEFVKSTEVKPPDSEHSDVPDIETTEVISGEIQPANNVKEVEVSPVDNKTDVNIEKESIKTMKTTEYPSDLNPFGDSEDEDTKPKVEPCKVNTNPFGSDSDEEEELPKPPPRTTPRKMSVSMRSTASTNPFDSDEDDDIENTPVPLPRRSEQSSPEPTPFPRRSKLRTSARSITSLSSIGSYSSTSPRKKRPAPPPPTMATLSPSSRYSSVSSLNRPRKNKRAPLPPSPAQASLPKSNDSTPDTSIVSEGHVSIPHIEIVDHTETEEANARATGELVAQIEEGLQKLIAQDNDPSKSESTLPEAPMESEPPSSEIPQEVQPKTSGSLETTSDVTVKDNETVHESLTVDSCLTIKDEKVTLSAMPETSLNVDTEILEDEANQTDKLSQLEKNESDVPVVFVGKEELSCDKSIEKVEDLENINNEKTGEIIETYNEILLSDSRNNSVIQFEEIKQPVHSTPVKIIPSLELLESSTEDVTFNNSLYAASNLSSPAASCPDSSSYQGSLSSPPTEKKYKDSANMHRKISESGVYHPPKSMYGQWKRKKAPAPPLPIPTRRTIKPMAIQRIRQELSDIEIKQQELERQGVSLEEKIREKFDTDTSITPYLENLVLHLFELVNEKNELFRKQAELMYIRRQHQLEEEHAELEYQIRCLMARPEANKTDTDKELEEKLIQRLVEVVERRDAIVQCLEMDRLREVEEDKSINHQLDRFTQAIITDDRMKIKKKHKKKKDKHNTLKMLDLEKEIEESEKESRKKKKWYTLHHKMSKNL